jgi:hypothetical protein
LLHPTAISPHVWAVDEAACYYDNKATQNWQMIFARWNNDPIHQAADTELKVKYQLEAEDCRANQPHSCYMVIWRGDKKDFVCFLTREFLIAIFIITEHKSVLPIKVKTAFKYGSYVYHYRIKVHIKFIQIITNTVSEAYLESKCWWWGILRVAWRWRAKNDWPCPELSAAKRWSTASRSRFKPWNVRFRIVMHYHVRYV